MIKDGFYRIHYSAVIPDSVLSPGGMWVVENGIVRGTEKNYIFTGTISQNDNDTVLAEISVWAPLNSVFPTVSGKHSLYLSGTVSGDSFHLTGEADIFGVRGIWIHGDCVMPLMP